MTQALSLNGRWRFTKLAESTLDKRSIPLKKPVSRFIEVPSNWYLQGEEFAGEVLYEREFKAPHLKKGQAAFLRFKGADYFLKAGLNGHLLGTHEGYFQTFDFAATSALRERNMLKVWVESPKENREVWPHDKHLIKGIFNHHDARPGSWDIEHGQDHNTGGLWNGVELVIVDHVFLKRTQVDSVLLKNGEAVVNLKLVLINVAESGTYDIEVDFKGVGFPDRAKTKKNVHLQRGQTEVHLSQTFKKPRLWWTWDQGEPNLYHASISVHSSETGRVVEKSGVRFGIRQIQVTPEWKFLLNGRQFFPRATNIIPSQWLSEYTAQKIQRDVAMMKAANLNGVRVHAHVNREEFYEACDEAGLFVWQDFALQWSYEATDAFTRNACRQVKDMVKLLYNHPSIIVWCCHNEPSHNREVLDPVLARAVKEEDDSRFVDTQSDFRYHPYPGWYWEDSTIKDAFGAIGPDTTFFSEFGAQALPDMDSLKKTFSKKELWPPDWKAWALHDFQYHQTFNVAKVEMGKSLPEFVNNSQKYQAYLLKEYIQSFRLKKYKPMNGYFQFMFVDCWPSITWSVVDYFRKPKQGYFALQTVSQPLLPVWRIQTTRYNRGDVLNWGASFLTGLQMINDYPNPLKGLKVEARVVNPRGKVLFRESRTCDVPADSVTQPFAAQERFNHTKGFTIPEKGVYGTYQVQLRVWDKKGKLMAHNEQDFEVVPKKLKP
ncbi:MAG TPA: glycoside hydrolase family 2 TIM barrel-domain containing protein [bacterium]|nr:glycoside hydrolase family 2 TIM barrel-domain containing protein [bacterium]